MIVIQGKKDIYDYNSYIKAVAVNRQSCNTGSMQARQEPRADHTALSLSLHHHYTTSCNWHMSAVWEEGSLSQQLYGCLPSLSCSKNLHSKVAEINGKHMYLLNMILLVCGNMCS